MEKDIFTTKYNEMLREIIAEVKMTRVIVANRLSTTVTQLYWNIGKRLSIEKLEKGYGGRVVEQLSADLKSEFPDTEGFSPCSLLYMKRLYEFYTNGYQISPQLVAEFDVALVADEFTGLPDDLNLFPRLEIKKPYIRIESKTYPTDYFHAGDPFIKEIQKEGIIILDK